MVQRLTYCKRYSYATKSNQHRVVKTPGMSPFERQDILLPSSTNGVKDLHISASHSSGLALFASLGKKLSVLRHVCIKY
ncbi:60S ribosomal protein L34 [Glycine max]|nr:60S ribosomal protein L34 [Glycine max]